MEISSTGYKAKCRTSAFTVPMFYKESSYPCLLHPSGTLRNMFSPFHFSGLTVTVFTSLTFLVWTRAKTNYHRLNMWTKTLKTLSVGSQIWFSNSNIAYKEGRERVSCLPRRSRVFVSGKKQLACTRMLVQLSFSLQNYKQEKWTASQWLVKESGQLSAVSLKLL